MKKLLLLCMTLVLVFSFAACQAKKTGTNPPNNTQNNQGKDENKNLEGSLEDILKKIYDTAKVSDNFKAYMKDGLQTTKITDERVEYYLGKKGIEFESAIASEPVMSTSAYELDLVRVKKGADIEQVKKEIKDNVNPMKWVCVGVDPKNVIVDNIGDVIIVIMSDTEGKALYDAFLALKG